MDRPHQIPSAVTRLSLLLKYAALFIAVAYIGLYLGVASFRLRYPFELEWMEGGSVEHVRRLLVGQQIYVAPSLDFIPYPYPPFYYYVSAAVAQLSGLKFESLRLVSLMASLISFLTIFLSVKQETSNPYAASLATGLFAATFRIGGAWFDIARVDSLFLMLVLVGLYIVRFQRAYALLVCAGLLFSLAILTKQTALIMTAPVIGWLAMTDRKKALVVAAVIGVVAGGGTFVLQQMSGGWYTYYVFDLPGHFTARIVRSSIWSFWSQDLLSHLNIACALAVAGIAGAFSACKNRGAFYLLMAAGAVVAAWLPRIQSAGYDNTLMPAHAGIAITFGIGVHYVMQYARRWSPHDRVVVGIAVYVLCLFQFGALFYSPRQQIPTNRDLHAGNALVATLENIQGRLFMPYHSGCYVPQLRERCGSAQQMAIQDIIRFGSDEARTILESDYRKAIAERRYVAIVMDSGGSFFQPEFEKHYEKRRLDFGGPDVLWTLTGYRTRPEFIFLGNSP
jgi:4-amino-4-deoxy-L-arabinose transferase-like glycosyltransferase